MAKNNNLRSCRRSQFVSVEQKQYLLNLLDEYPKLREPVQQNPSLREIWSDATAELNMLPGPKKPTNKWRRTLHDLLYRESKRKMKETKKCTTELPYDTYLFVESYEEKKVMKSTVDKEYRHALIHGEDPNLSDSASWTESPSHVFPSWTPSEEDETDENVHGCDVGVGRGQMAIVACSYDDICVHADSVTPPSFLEEIVMYGLNQREITA